MKFIEYPQDAKTKATAKAQEKGIQATITCTNIIYAYNPLMIPSTSQGTSHGKPHHLHTDWNANAPLNQLFSCLT